MYESLGDVMLPFMLLGVSKKKRDEPLMCKNHSHVVCNVTYFKKENTLGILQHGVIRVCHKIPQALTARLSIWNLITHVSFIPT